MTETKRDESIRVLLSDGTEALAPTHEVLEGIRQGKWKLPETDLDGNKMTLPVNDALGSFETSASYLNANAEQAIKDGLAMSTFDYIEKEGQAKREKVLAETYDNPTTTGILSAIDAATIGAGKFIGAGVNALGAAVVGEDAGKAYDKTLETYKNLKKANPNAALVGDVAGTVLPAVLSGGTSLAARGAQKTAAGVISNIATKAGEKAAAKVAAKYGLKEGVRQSALRMGTTGLVEGALLSGGRTIVDEALLGEPSENYGKVFESVLSGALLEGAIGASLGAAGRGVEAILSKGLSKAEDIVKQPKLWNQLKKAYGKTVKVTKDSDAVEKLFDSSKFNQEQVARYLDDMTQADKDIAAEVQKFVDAAQDMTTESQRLRKVAMQNPALSQKVADLPKGTLKRTSVGINSIENTLKEASENAALYEPGFVARLKQVDSTLKDALLSPGLTPAQKLQRQAGRAVTPIEAPTTVRDLIEGHTKARQGIDDLMARYRQKQARGEPLTVVEENTQKLLQNMRNDVQSVIRDYDLYGAAAKEIKKADRIYANVIEPLRKIKSIGSFDSFKELVGEGGDVLANTATKEFDAERIGRILRKTSTGKQKAALEAAKETLSDSMKRLKNEIGSLEGIDVDQVARIDKIDTIVELTKDIQSIERQTGRNLEGILLGATLGAGPAILGAAVSNPVFMTRQLIKMEKAALNFDKSVEAFKARYASPLKVAKKVKAATTTAIKKAGRIAPLAVSSVVNAQNDLETVQALRDGSAFDAMRSRAQMIQEIAPQNAQEMLNSIDRAQASLQRVLPTLAQHKTVGQRDAKLVLSPSQQSKVNQALTAAFAPNEFVKMVTEGTATSSGMQVLREVHPDLYMQLQQGAIEAASSPETPRQNKLKLQYLFKIPVTSDLSDLNMKQQRVYGEASEAAPPGRERTPLRAKGLDELNIAEASSPVSASF